MSSATVGTDTILLNSLLDEFGRYQCPECESHTVAVRRKVGYPANYKEIRDDDAYGTVHQKNKHIDAKIHDCRCDRCGAVFDRPLDKKRGERRLLRDEHSLIGGSV